MFSYNFLHTFLGFLLVFMYSFSLRFRGLFDTDFLDLFSGVCVRAFLASKHLPFVFYTVFLAFSWCLCRGFLNVFLGFSTFLKVFP